MHGKVLRMIKLPLHSFQENILNNHNKAIIKYRMITLLETANGQNMRPIKLLKGLYTDSRLEERSLRSYTWRQMVFESCGTSANNWRRALLRTWLSQSSSPNRWSSMQRLRSVLKSALTSKVGLALVRMKNPVHRLPLHGCLQPLCTHHPKKMRSSSFPRKPQ